MSLVLRDYQERCADAVITEWQEHPTTLVVKPTGCGKTITFAEIIRRSQPKRAMVLAHREELIFQAKHKIEAVTGLSCEIEMAEMKASTSLFHKTPVVISTIQTQISGNGTKRFERFNPDDFGILVIDEAHHATAQSYRKVIEHYRKNPNLKVVGVTATPDRADEEALGQVFETCCFDYEILDAINDGWLVTIKQKFVAVEGLDFSHIRTTAGDLNGGDLAEVMEQEKNLQGIAGATIQTIENRRAIVFTASVKHAEMLCNIFNRHRDGMAEWVHCGTEKHIRREILRHFATGKIQVVCNCGVLTEGFDDPGVEVIVMARPTKSRCLYAQMVGRSDRPLPGIVDGPATAELRKQAIEQSAKPDCLVLDFVGNSGKHKLITTADILGGNVSDDVLDAAVEKVRKSGVAVNMAEAIQEAELEKIKRIELAKRQEEARKAKLVAKVSFACRDVSPFDVFDMSPPKERGWDRGKRLTEKQLRLLQNHVPGVNVNQIGYVEGKMLIGELFRRWNEKLATFKQAKWLKKKGYSADIPMATASQLMDAWAKNGWQRPVEAEAEILGA